MNYLISSRHYNLTVMPLFTATDTIKLNIQSVQAS